MTEANIWWRKSPEEFDRFKRELEAFETLSFQVEGDLVSVHGSWAVFGESKLITRYEVKIELPDDFPQSAPRVFEVGGRIPKEPDYHINPGDNSACVFAQPERYEKWPPGSGIRDFLNGPMKEFFFSQAFRELNGTWPFGEWSHGGEGILEYYASRLGTGDLGTLRELLKLALLPKLYRQWPCPCNPEVRVTACHADRVRTLSGLIPRDEIDLAIRLAQLELNQGTKSVRIHPKK